MPWLYHKYSGHDNNRDSYMTNLVETKNITRLVNQEWFPEILYNQHQTGPFPTRIFVPPQAEPTNPNIHPLMLRWQNLIGTAMAAAFEQENKPGVVSGIRYDSWYPGYETQAVDGHNIISILTETNLYRFATPHLYTLADFPEPYRDFLPSVFYPNPWKGGWWRLGDAVAYNLTASKAVLHTAAVYREQLLYDKYRAGAGVTARFKKEPPYAWIVPPDQWDPPTAALLLNNLKLLGIEVYEGRQHLHLGRPLVSRRHLGHPDEPAVRAVREEPVRGAGLPGPDEVPGRVAGSRQPADVQGRVPAALRHRGLDAALPDGRQGPPRQHAAHRRR